MLAIVLLLVYSEQVKVKDDCPKAFNGAYTYIDKKEVLIYRCDRGSKYQNGQRMNDNSVWIQYEDKNIKVPFQDPKSFKNQFAGAEDPRVFIYNNEQYIYYSGSSPYQIDPVRSIVIHKLADAMAGKPTYKFLYPTLTKDHASMLDKNWLMFDNGTAMNAVYTLNPFVLGYVNKRSLELLYETNYDCLQKYKIAHIGSNGIKLMMGMPMIAFIMSVKTFLNGGQQYKNYILWMNTHYPHDLYGVSDEWTTDEPSQYFKFYQNIAIEGKSTLDAHRSDTLVISGGVDDYAIFKKRIPAYEFMDLKISKCTRI